MDTYRIADLFAGVGGVRLGFDRAFGKAAKTVFVSDIDHFAAQVYTDNFGHDPEVSGDITEIDVKDIPDFDICLAGFPCQAFSNMGLKQGFKDPRGQLFQEVVRICKAKQPKVIFCENVKALVNYNKGEAFNVIKAAFEKIGYKVYHQVLNSADFNVPQNRERVYIVCFRKDIAPDGYTVCDAGKVRSGGIEKILLPDSEVAKHVLSDKYVAFLERRKEKSKASGNGFSYRVKEPGDIAGTLTCSPTSLDGNLVRYKDRLRKLAPRECARLQGFPDTFKLNVSDTQVYRLMGNSVTVPVIETLAKKILTVLRITPEKLLESNEPKDTVVLAPAAPNAGSEYRLEVDPAVKTTRVEDTKAEVREFNKESIQRIITRRRKKLCHCPACQCGVLPLECRACMARMKRRMGIR